MGGSLSKYLRFVREFMGVLTFLVYKSYNYCNLIFLYAIRLYFLFKDRCLFIILIIFLYFIFNFQVCKSLNCYICHTIDKSKRKLLPLKGIIQP